MRTKQSVVRIQDVARAAGVSVTTASRVLNNKDDVAPETYEKVRRVIKAQNLIQKRYGRQWAHLEFAIPSNCSSPVQTVS